MKRGISMLHEEVVEPLTPSEERRLGERAMSNIVAQHVQLENIQLIIVDEAGTKTPAEIRGFADVYDTALRLGHPLSILLVGMDDLAHKTSGLGVIKSRVRSRWLFKQWDDLDYGVYVASRCRLLRALRAQNIGAFEKLMPVLREYTKSDLRATLSLMPLVDGIGRGRTDISDVVKEVIASDSKHQEDSDVFALKYEANANRHNRAATETKRKGRGKGTG